ncbi:TMEM175 family protein [Maribacter aestuarii]|uniref:TMEM175 family protein n=1 Tax=Maribacter aestuarii TaxID=1130723 RepID=UPI00248B69F6|nr:TMEM175 family protein [Maribacter aestuarii]
MEKHKFFYDKNRVTAFCDAVFSIAMTLLILEIEVPSVEALNTHDFMSLLANRIPSFIGFLVSFLVIALYWVSHLRIYKYVTELSEKFVWLNIFLLLFVVFLPFSTALYVGDFNGTAPFVFYCLNLVLLGLFNFLLVRTISKKEIGNNGMTNDIGNWLQFRSLNAVIIWALAAVLASFFPLLARLIFILIFVFQIIGDQYFKRKIDKYVS